MPNLSIKDVPEAWAQALRQRAARNHRSLQGELMALIQGVVAPEVSDNSSTSLEPGSMTTALSASPPRETGRHGTVVGVDRFGHPVIRQGWKTVEQIAAELKAKYPHGPGPNLGSSIDMIREDRDSR